MVELCKIAMPPLKNTIQQLEYLILCMCSLFVISFNGLYSALASFRATQMPVLPTEKVTKHVTTPKTTRVINQ